MKTLTNSILKYAINTTQETGMTIAARQLQHHFPCANKHCCGRPKHLVNKSARLVGKIFFFYSDNSCSHCFANTMVADLSMLL